MKYQEHLPGSLMAETAKLLKESGKAPQDIYAETGLPFHWVKKFATGEFENPSVNRVQFLYEYLSGNALLLTNK
jgi:hypothetical protein